MKQILGAIKGVTIDKFVADNTTAEKEKQFITNKSLKATNRLKKESLQERIFHPLMIWLKN